MIEVKLNLAVKKSSSMSNQQATPVTKVEIQQVIDELLEYRERMVNDLLQMGQKVKLSKKATQEHLDNHPEIARIDAALDELGSQLASL